MLVVAALYALLFLAGSKSPSLVDCANAGEWYHECKGDSCGYGRRNDNDDCRDSDPSNCPGFARQGECFANPGWMLVNCKRSCGVCYKERMARPDGSPNDDDCSDKHSQCPLWASQMECFANPAYMAQACPASCWLCVNSTALREQGVSETEIDRRRKFSLTDFGLWQSIPSGAKDAAVRERVHRMGQYVVQLNNTGPGTVCNNRDHNCATWATENDACRTNLLLMLSHCSLVCEYCDVIETYHKCRQGTFNRAQSPFQDVASVYNHLVTQRGAIDLVHGTGSCSRDDAQSDDEGVCKLDKDKIPDEWVLSVDMTMLWRHGGTSPHEDLVKFLKSKGAEWLDVPHIENSRSGQVLNLKWESEPIVERFVAALSDLMNIPHSLFELEFVRYQRGQRFESHQDVRLHDLWKFSGARVLSAYVLLAAPIEGGAFGFPDFDWLLVDDPQIMIWPNVKSLDPGKSLERMKSEQLPVVKGELYAAQIWVHEYTFDEKNLCS
jgi:hypothetical protein